MAFLNPEGVERQGGQNQLYERSAEKGLFLKKFVKKIERKIPPQIFGNWAIFAWPSGQAQNAQNHQKVRA